MDGTRTRVRISQIISAAIMLIALAWFAGWAIGRAIDANIDDYNVMLCGSATRSGNAAVLRECREYYESGNIEYLRAMDWEQL